MASVAESPLLVDAGSRVQNTTGGAGIRSFSLRAPKRRDPKVRKFSERTREAAASLSRAFTE